jgi:hypothetical protein
MTRLLKAALVAASLAAASFAVAPPASAHDGYRYGYGYRHYESDRDGGYRYGGYDSYRHRRFHRFDRDRRWERDRYDGHRYGERWNDRDR